MEIGGIVDYVYALLESKKVVLLSAYPGFGKTRVAINIAKRWSEDGGEVLLITRSRAEALQLCEFARQVGIRDRTAMFLGRESLCPFNAHDAKQCLLYRMSGLCKVRARVSITPVDTCDPIDVFNEGSCPYEVNEALAYQLPIIISTHSYLSSPELYSKLSNIINDWRRPLVIIDEFHNVISGLETSIGISLDELKQWASHGNELARKILERTRDYVPQREVVVARRFDIDDVLRGSEKFSDKVLEILTHYGTDMCAFTYDGKLVRLRCVSFKPIRDLIARADRALLLTASVSRRFSHIVNVVSESSYYVAVDSLPKEYRDNFTVFVVRDVEFTYNNRLLKNYLDLVDKSIKIFIESAPPVGGLGIFFPSIEYMNTYINNYSPPIWGVPTFILGDSDETLRLINEFKGSARITKSVVITYAQNPIGEGVNFLEQELIGIMIIGFPLPQYSQWGFLKARYYQRMGIGGFTTAFLFPAISTTVQVLGRLLRDLDRHRKVAVLLDRRYYQYRRLLPRWLALSIRAIGLSQLMRGRLW